MFRSHLLLHSFVSALAVAFCSVPASARPDGMAADCGGCHYGELGGGVMTPRPNVTAVPGAPRVEPGEPLDITINVESTWSEAVVAGFLILSESEEGVFVPVDEGTGNVGAKEGEVLTYSIGHKAARALQDGATAFRASWTAPMSPGTYGFKVYAVTSNDGDGMDDPDVNEETNDSVGKSSLKIGVGCDAVAYFSDLDLDGYGGEEQFACEQPAGTVMVGGDCQDDNPAVNPGAVEECSFVDENCDGEAMAPPTFYRDLDGDGYGEVSEIVVDKCEPPEGYAPEYGDCAPTDPLVHPGAAELPGNTIDDNCNGMVDEAAEEVGGAPAVAGGGPGIDPFAAGMAANAGAGPVEMGGAVMEPEAGLAGALAPTSSDTTDGSGCGMLRPRGSSGLELGISWMLFCAELVRRRRAGRRRS